MLFEEPRKPCRLARLKLRSTGCETDVEMLLRNGSGGLGRMLCRVGAGAKQ